MTNESAHYQAMRHLIGNSVSTGPAKPPAKESDPASQVILAKLKAWKGTTMYPEYFDTVKDIAIQLPIIIGEHRLVKPRTPQLMAEIGYNVCAYAVTVHPDSEFWLQAQKASGRINDAFDVWSDKAYFKAIAAAGNLGLQIRLKKLHHVTIGDVLEYQPKAFLPSGLLLPKR